MHYSVLVIGDYPEIILEPFQENNMWNCPKEFLEFEIEVSKEDFEKMSDEEKEETKNDYDEHEWDYWYWSNPNSIWDWYEIWGRWAWMLSLKDINKKEEYPDINFSWGWSEKDKEEYKNSNKVDQAKMKDIDWEWMRKEKYNFLLEKYDFFKKVTEWIELNNESFKEIIRNENKKYHESKWDYKLHLYYIDKLEDFNFNTREEFAEFHSKDFFSTYYIVSEDLWAITSDSHFDSTWEINTDELSFYDRFIKDLDPETLITIVDCHS